MDASAEITPDHLTLTTDCSAQGKATSATVTVPITVTDTTLSTLAAKDEVQTFTIP